MGRYQDFEGEHGRRRVQAPGRDCRIHAAGQVRLCDLMVNVAVLQSTALLCRRVCTAAAAVTLAGDLRCCGVYDGAAMMGEPVVGTWLPSPKLRPLTALALPSFARALAGG